VLNSYISCVVEMKQLEPHPMFNPALKVVDAPQKEKKTLPVTEDLAFSVFEQTEKAPPKEKGFFLHSLSDFNDELSNCSTRYCTYKTQHTV